MADTSTHTTHYAADAIEAASRERGEPGWLTDKRAESARAFATLQMPTKQMRPWKYTDVSGLDFEAYAPAEAGQALVEGVAPSGGFAGSLSAALADDAAASIAQQHLGSLIPATEGKFIAANASQWQGGALVYAPRGQAFEAPVTVRIDASGVDHGSVFPRLLVVAEANAEVTVLVRCLSGSEALLASGVTEILAGPDSRVRVVFDLDWGSETQDFTTVRARTDRGADVRVATLAIGGKLLKQTVEGILEGEGSTTRIRGVALGDEKQHFDFVTLQDHVGPRTQSDVQIKTALAGASRAIYYGVTRVEETGKGSHAEQVNRNLLLSEHAKADSDPVLEILTNDVIRCGHGATVGPVDPEAFFYLQSRGLTRRQALTLLVSGFFQSVLSDVGDETLAEEVAAEVELKLASADISVR